MYEKAELEKAKVKLVLAIAFFAVAQICLWCVMAYVCDYIIYDKRKQRYVMDEVHNRLFGLSTV